MPFDPNTVQSTPSLPAIATPTLDPDIVETLRRNRAPRLSPDEQRAIDVLNSPLRGGPLYESALRTAQNSDNIAYTSKGYIPYVPPAPPAEPSTNRIFNGQTQTRADFAPGGQTTVSYSDEA